MKKFLLVVCGLLMMFLASSVLACENCDCGCQKGEKCNCKKECIKECPKDCDCGCHKGEKCTCENIGHRSIRNWKYALYWNEKCIDNDGCNHHFDEKNVKFTLLHKNGKCKGNP